MSSNLKFHQKNGLTAYSFACGNIQRAAYAVGDYELRVDLWHEGACYHVRAHEHGGRGRLVWDSFGSLTEARKFWAQTVALYHGERIATVKADKRYAVASEFCGEREPYYVARDCGGWIGKSATVQGAWLLAYRAKQQLAVALGESA
jgi:hypothetical protein